MGKVGGVKKVVVPFGEVFQNFIGNLFDTFLKLLFLINSPSIHPCLASFSLLIGVILWILKG